MRVGVRFTINDVRYATELEATPTSVEVVAPVEPVPERNSQRPKKPGPVALATDFAKAAATLAKQGPVSDAVYEHRITICTGVTVEGVRLSEPCDAYKGEDKGRGSGHCKGCGCPDWPISEMTKKARFPKGCPRSKWSEMSGVRSAAADGDARVAGG